MLILWKDDVDLCMVGYSMGHIDSEIVDKEGLRWRFTWVYGHSNKYERKHTWERRALLLETLLKNDGGRREKGERRQLSL